MRRRVFGRKEDALKALGGERLPVFSECIEPTSDRRQWVVQDAETYASTLMQLPWQKRRTHELLQADVPCRLFFDLESENMAEDDMQATVDRLVVRVHEAWPTSVAIVLDGSRPGKQSRHVVFDLDIYFPTLTDMAAEALRLAGEEPCFDRGVYYPGRTFRAPFCTGFGKTTHLRGPDESPEAFVRALVHVYRPGAPVMDRANTLLPRKRLRIDSDDGAWKDDELGDMVEYVQSWLLSNMWPEAKFAPQCRIQHFRTMSDVCWSAKGIPCPVVGRPHRSNNTYVHLSLSARGLSKGWVARHVAVVRCVCLDHECMATQRHVWTVANVPTALVGFQKN